MEHAQTRPHRAERIARLLVEMSLAAGQDPRQREKMALAIAFAVAKDKGGVERIQPALRDALPRVAAM
jgi:hypothetical protein